MEIETRRIKRFIFLNKFRNDTEFNRRSDDNLILNFVIKANFKKLEFWKLIKKNKGIDFKTEIERILYIYDVKLI